MKGFRFRGGVRLYGVMLPFLERFGVRFCGVLGMPCRGISALVVRPGRAGFGATGDIRSGIFWSGTS